MYIYIISGRKRAGQRRCTEIEFIKQGKGAANTQSHRPAHTRTKHTHTTLYIAPSLRLFKLFNQTQISSDRRGNKLATLYWPQGTRFEARWTRVEVGNGNEGGRNPTAVRGTAITIYIYMYKYVCVCVCVYTRTLYINRSVKTTCVRGSFFFFLRQRRLVKRLAETTAFLHAISIQKRGGTYHNIGARGVTYI